jgi:hypothetical protein
MLHDRKGRTSQLIWASLRIAASHSLNRLADLAFEDHIKQESNRNQRRKRRAASY